METGDGERGPRGADTGATAGGTEDHARRTEDHARRTEAAEVASPDVARHIRAIFDAGDPERARLLALFAALPVGVVLVDARAADLPIVFANAAFSALTGYPAPAVLGRNCRFLQGPDTDPVAVATLRRAWAAGTGCTVTLRNYRRDGTPFWNELTLAPLRDTAGQVVAYVGVQVDATARVEAERQRTLQAAVLDATAEGIYGIDHAGRCTFINPAATLLGYTPDALIGRDMHALVHHHRRDGTPYPPDACPIHQAAAGGQGVRVADEVIWRRDGTAVPVEYAVQPMAGPGSVGAVVTLVDVTERARAEHERAALLARERAARAEAEASVTQRDHLLSLAAHDLRTPLAALIGEVQLRQRRLRRGRPLSMEEQGSFLATLHDLLQRQVSVVSEVTDAAYVQMGERLALRVESVDLGALAGEVADMLAHAHGAGTAVIDVVEAPMDVVIVGDRDRLARVLQNIIGNAVKYSPAGAPVQVSVRAEGAGAVVVVRDAGVGIPAGEIDRVFTPFYRASTARGVAGTGLGLAGARGIVAQHGGTIALESAPGVGTTVTITLPGAERTAGAS